MTIIRIRGDFPYGHSLPPHLRYVLSIGIESR